MIKIKGGKGLTNDEWVKREEEELEPKWFSKLSENIYNKVPHCDHHNSECTWVKELIGKEEGHISLSCVVDNEKELLQTVLRAREICKKGHAIIIREETDMILHTWAAEVKLDKLSHFAKHGYGRKKRGQNKSSHKKR